MCGILGSPNITPTVRRMLPHLALSMENRGGDAWGASDGRAIIKHVGTISRSWWSEHELIDSWDAGIFHTRGASVGDKDKIENAHPFRCEGPDGLVVIGIHNGGLSNWSELNTKYSRHCSVDSEHLWLHRAAGLPWTDIRGHANVAWWELKPVSDGGAAQREMYIAKVDAQSLSLMRVEDGGLVFASTESALREAAYISGSYANTVYSLKSNHIYHLSTDGTPFELPERLEFSAYAANNFHPYTQIPSQSRTPGHTSRPSHMCFRCSKTTEVESELLCGVCFMKMIDRYKLTQTPTTPGVINNSALDDDDAEELMRMGYGC